MLTKLGFLKVPHGHFYEPKTELFGKFQKRIDLWAKFMGRPVPWPTIIENDTEKLNPEFSEWMIGLPLGWVTDAQYGLTRVKKLEQIGNGVSPAQATMALDDLLADEFIYDPPPGENMSDQKPTAAEVQMMADAGISVQPDPQPNDLPSAHDLVAADLLARKEYGFNKYATLLQPFNGRDGLQDGYEEMMDLMVYMRTRLFQGRTQQADAFLSGYIQALLDSGKSHEEVLEIVDGGLRHGNPFGHTTDEALHEKFDAAGYGDEQKLAAFHRFQADLAAIEAEKVQATGDMHESMSAVTHQ